MSANFLVNLVCVFFTVISGGVAFASANKITKIISVALACIAILVALVLNTFPMGGDSEDPLSMSTSVVSITPTITEEPNDMEMAGDSFYGIWCSGAKTYEGAQNNLKEAQDSGLANAEIILTTDWANLNHDTWYVITAGRYENEDEAKAALPEVQSTYPDAYVKNTGRYQGSN